MRDKLIVIIILFFISQFLFGDGVDSLKTQLEISDGIEKVRILNLLSARMWDLDPELGIDYANQALEELDKDVASENLALAYKNIAINNWVLTRLDKSEEYNFKALEVFQELGIEDGISNIYVNLALVYINKEDYEQAIKYQFMGLEIQEKLDDKIGMVHSTNNLGLIYANEEQYQEALTYFIRSYELQKELSLDSNLAYSLNNIGVMYQQLGNNQKALEYYNKALSIEKKHNNKRAISSLYYNMAKIDIDNGDLDSALEKTETSLEIRKEFGEPTKIIESSFRLIAILIDQKRLPQAWEEIVKVEKMINEHESIESKIFLLELKISYFEVSKRYKEAFLEYQRLASKKDSLFSANKLAQIKEIESKYNLAKKDKENEILKINNQMQALELERNKTQQNFFITLLIAGLLAIAVIFYNYRLKLNANKQLKSKNRLIRKQKRELNNAYKKLKEEDESKDKFISIMAHDIKNPLVAQISGYRLLLSKIELLGDDDVLSITREMQKNTVHLLSLLDNLLQWSRLQNGGINYNPGKLDIHEVVLRSSQLYKMKADLKRVKIINEIGENSFVYGDRDMMISILNNLLTNAIKFSNPEQVIKLFIIEKENNIEIHVKDSGVGISEEKMEQLFRLDVNPSSLGTKKEKGTGLGLILAKDFAEKNNGKLTVKSEVGKGTTIIVTLPKYLEE